MNNRERINAILHYQKYDRMPVVAFAYWTETATLWAEQGYITKEEAEDYCRNGDNGFGDKSIMAKLGFDFNWNSVASACFTLMPPFEKKVLKVNGDGSKIVRNEVGLIERVNDDITSIPATIGTTLTGREAWETLYKPRLQYAAERLNGEMYKKLAAESDTRDFPLGLHVGSLYGNIRNMVGFEDLIYLSSDDEELYAEIVDTEGQLCYDITKKALSFGVKFDYAHFWEDICFKNGPMVSPDMFRKYVGPHYKRITDLLKEHGIDIVSLDCDGKIDALVPVWLENGVNTMFPIEVGTWNASIAPWREKYGRALRGVGGMDKRVFAHDKAAVDAEIERLKVLVDLGGYIPCPDHRIAPDAKFPLVAYYCEQFRKKIV